MDPEEAEILQDWVSHGAVAEDPSYKVQLKKQGNRSNIVIFLAQIPSEGIKKWRQKCQMVVKDLPNWVCVLAMKQLAGRVLTGDLDLASVKSEKDQLMVDRIQKNEWLPYMSTWGPNATLFTSEKYRAFIASRNLKLQPAPLNRAQHLNLNAGQDSASGFVESAASSKMPGPKPPVENRTEQTPCLCRQMMTAERYSVTRVFVCNTHT